MSQNAIAAALIVLAGATLLTMQHAVGFVGWDTYPIIAASRIESLADLRGTFTESLASGYFPFGFYRPVMNLSIATDYALWGLAPFGYLLSNVLLFAVCALMLHRLARALLGTAAVAGPLVALLTLIVLPVHRELTTGPFANRSDLLCGLFVVLALHTQLRRIDAAGWPVVPALCTVLAQASKESAVVLPALVFVLALVAAEARTGRRRVLGAVRLGGVHALAVLVVLVPRTIVLGGIAGHVGTRPEALPARYPGALAQVVLGLLAKRPPFTTGRGDGLVVLLVLVSVLVAAVLHLRARRAQAAAAIRATATVLLGLALILGFAAVYAIVGWVVPWYLYLPAIGLALACAGVTEGALLLARRRVAPWRAAYGVPGLLAAWLAWQLATSPLLRPDAQWVSWTEQNDTFVAQLQPRLAATPDGAELHIAYPADVLQTYTVRAWTDLVVPGRGVRVVTAREPHSDSWPGPTVVLERGAGVPVLTRTPERGR